jgi:hypothetical protein
VNRSKTKGVRAMTKEEIQKQIAQAAAMRKMIPLEGAFPGDTSGRIEDFPMEEEQSQIYLGSGRIGMSQREAAIEANKEHEQLGVMRDKLMAIDPKERSKEQLEALWNIDNEIRRRSIYNTRSNAQK